MIRIDCVTGNAGNAKYTGIVLGTLIIRALKITRDMVYRWSYLQIHRIVCLPYHFLFGKKKRKTAQAYVYPDLWNILFA